jgi:hypothetical protein
MVKKRGINGTTNGWWIFGQGSADQLRLHWFKWSYIMYVNTIS